MSDFICGGAGALCSICCVHPIDVVKTRLQMRGETRSCQVKQDPKGFYGRHGVVSSLFQIGKTEGAKGLYRGLSAAMCLQILVTGTRFGTYELFKKYSPVESNVANFFLGMGSGVIGAALGTPFFRLKTQMQCLSDSKAMQVGYQHKETGRLSLFQAFSSIYSQEGVRGYFRGGSAMILRVASYSATQLSVYDYIKSVSQNNLGLRSDSVVLHTFSSTITAFVAVTALQPFDFLTARLTNQPLDKLGKPLFYKSVGDCILKVVREEGPLGLFKGCTANCECQYVCQYLSDKHISL